MNSAAADVSPTGELQTLLASRVPLVVIESREEGRVIELVRDAAMRAQRGRNWGVFQWTVTEGLLRIDVNLGGAQRTLAQPDQLLRHIKSTTMPGIYVLLDFHPYLENPLFVRTLKDIAQEYDKCARTLVLTSFEMKLPQELEHLAARFSVKLPDKAERHAIVMRTAREWSKMHGAMPRVDVRAVEKLVDNLAGLPLHDVERLTRQIVFNDGALTEDDLKPLLAAKYQLLNRGGTLSFEPDTARFADVGGLRNLRRWILQRKPAFDGSAPGLDPPKGVLLLGVQGCGKSLAARAAAGVLGVPLVRLDFGALYSKWHGESEKNLRESLTSAQLLSDQVVALEDPKIQRLAPRLVQSIDKAVGFAQSVLDYGRQAGAPPKPVPVDLRALVDESAIDADAMRHPGIAYANEVPDGITINADPDQLARVLVNLLKNAREALEASGDRTEDPQIRVGFSETAEGFMLSIADNGPGLPPRARENLFVAFEGSAKAGGTGLGLAIARELVAAHGGTLTYTPLEPGTRFDLSFPATLRLA